MQWQTDKDWWFLRLRILQSEEQMAARMEDRQLIVGIFYVLTAFFCRGTW